MGVNLHLLKASGRLLSFEARIDSAFRNGIELISSKLELPDVDVVVADNAQAAIEETGVGGHAPTAHLLYINIDPNHPDLNKNLEQEIKSTLAHELHHCARWKTIGYGTSLLEACVSEGLADHFDLEINGGVVKPWSIAVQGKDLEALANRAKTVFNVSYDENVWFWGKGDLPKWAAYSLGFEMVGNYIAQTGKTASELVDADASLLLK